MSGYITSESIGVVLDKLTKNPFCNTFFWCRLICNATNSSNWSIYVIPPRVSCTCSSVAVTPKLWMASATSSRQGNEPEKRSANHSVIASQHWWKFCGHRTKIKNRWSQFWVKQAADTGKTPWNNVWKYCLFLFDGFADRLGCLTISEFLNLLCIPCLR